MLINFIFKFLPFLFVWVLIGKTVALATQDPEWFMLAGYFGGNFAMWLSERCHPYDVR